MFFRPRTLETHAKQHAHDAGPRKSLKAAGALTVAVLLATLAACGGGGNDATSAADVQNTSPPPDQPASATDTTTPVSSNLVDKLFRADSPSRFYQFGERLQTSPDTRDSDMVTLGTKILAGMIHTYIDPASDNALAQVVTPISESYALPSAHKSTYPASENELVRIVTPISETYTLPFARPFTWMITKEGGSFPFIALALYQTSSIKVFEQSPSSIDIGSTTMTSPLYRVSFVANDISGKAINAETDSARTQATVDADDSQTWNSGLLGMLNDDASRMPQGSESYAFRYTALQTYVDQLDDVGEPVDSLEELQKSLGGSIESLGQYRVLDTNSTLPQTPSCRLAYVGSETRSIFAGCLHRPGDILTMKSPRGYNKIAADFITGRVALALPKAYVY